MTLLHGDTGRVSVGVLRTYKITMPPLLNQVYMDTNPMILPTAEGASQFTYTVTEGNIPLIVPKPISFNAVPIIHLAGKNLSSSTSTTISYKLLVNGVVMKSGTTGTIGALLNWSISLISSSIFTSGGIKAGDVIEIKLWSNQSTMAFDYHCLHIYPARLMLTKVGTIIKDITYTDMGVPSTASMLGRAPTINYNWVTAGVSGAVTTSISGSTLTFPVAQQSDITPTLSTGYGLYTPQFGDSNYRDAATVRTSSTNHPHVDYNRIYETITFREIEL